MRTLSREVIFILLLVSLSSTAIAGTKFTPPRDPMINIRSALNLPIPIRLPVLIPFTIAPPVFLVPTVLGSKLTEKIERRNTDEINDK